MEELQQRIDAVTARYRPELDRLQREGEDLAGQSERPSDHELILNVDFDVDWKDREIIFDLPSVTMRERRLSLDLPVVTKKRQRIVFDTPSVRMEVRIIGKYPVFRGTTIKWKYIKTKVPVPFLERQEIIYDIPEVRMERKDFSLKIPEFTKSRQRWVVRLPEFTVKSVKAEARELQQKGEDLQRRGEDIGARMRKEIDAVMAEFFGAVSEEGADLRDAVSDNYEAAIGATNEAINGLAAYKIDPIKVPTESGDLNLRKQYAELIAERDRVLSEIDAAGAVLADEEAAPEAAVA